MPSIYWGLPQPGERVVDLGSGGPEWTASLRALPWA
jgi:hypothetical protein